MIRSHLYVRKTETQVFDAPSDQGKPLYILDHGNWAGEVGRQGDWIQILGIDGAGWVRADDMEYVPPFQLHVHLTGNNQIKYISSVITEQ